MDIFGTPHMNVDDGRQLNVGQVMTSSGGIGTSAPHVSHGVWTNGVCIGGREAIFRIQ